MTFTIKQSDPTAVLDTYEAFPYAGYAYYQSTPDCLATLAKLSGMDPAAIDRARVLELGCASGDNLIPHAMNFPESTYVGIDLSPKQIASGQAMIEHLQLKNITLHAADFTTLKDELLDFDYIIGHGLFSWIAPETQHALLDLCAGALADQGVIYLSYNTYPGWHFQELLRGIMLNATRHLEDIHEKVQCGKETLELIRKANEGKDEVHQTFLSKELDFLNNMDASYLAHEYFEIHNNPVYFRDFVAMSEEHGLRFLAEANPTQMVVEETAAATEFIQKIDRSAMVETIQRLDYLNHVRFHSTLLCHKHQSLDWHWMQRQPLDDFYLYSFLEPQDHVMHVFAGAAVPFTHGNVRVVTQKPEEIAALIYLYEQKPVRVLFTDLLEAIDQRLQAESQTALFPRKIEPDSYRASLTLFLHQLFVRGCMDFHTQPGRYTSQISDYPQTTPLARIQAQKQDIVTTQIHRAYKINPVEKMLLPLLDGKRSKQALVEAIQAGIDEGTIPVNEADEETPKKVLAEDFANIALHSLCQAALLV